MRAILAAVLLLSTSLCAQTINLPSGKKLGKVPGNPQKLNSFPSRIVVSPDKRYAAILNQGYGTAATGNRQSIALYEIEKRQLREFPDDRLSLSARQTYFEGLAFSSKGDEIYASVASLTDPEGKREGSTGNGIAVYSFQNGEIKPARFLKIPLQQLADAKRFVYGDTKVPDGKAISYPAGLAVVPANAQHPHDRLLVANNLSDNAVLLDAVTGEVLKSFDLSTHHFVPAAFPFAAVVAPGGSRAWISLWNTGTVIELDLEKGRVKRKIKLESSKPGTSSAHATNMTLSQLGSFLFVSLTNRDSVAVVRTEMGEVVSTFDPAPRKTSPGMQPSGLALDAEGHLLIANSQLNSVTVMKVSRDDTICLDCDERAQRDNAPAFHAQEAGRLEIPTQWYPTAVAIVGDDILIASAKGAGTGPNKGSAPESDPRKKFPYIASLLGGSFQHVKLSDVVKNESSVIEDGEETSRKIVWHPDVLRTLPQDRRGRGPIRHVVYIIKENRTYDQVFGDLPVGDGDKTLTLYGADITPNQHKLALQFGVLDNFYDSGEISGNGHDWSMAATTSDYTERNWQIDYSRSQRTYDYEGMVGNRYPMEQGIPDVNEPGTGFLWALAARNKRTYRHYGEFINTEWCTDDENSTSPAVTGKVQGPCTGRREVKKGEPLPANVGTPKGGPSPWPWAVPMISRNVPTKPELVGHFDPLFPDFKTDYPDQLRVDEFLNEFDGFVAARKNGNKEKELPELIVLRLPNDHTIGTRANLPTPSACVADNDLAVGRVVEAISNSPYWDDTAILILEDDAQDGPDHVDAHRSLGLLISKYSPSSLEKPYVEHRFYTTVNMIRTLEDLLGLPCMNVNDCEAAPIAGLFAGDGSQKPFRADARNLENGLLYQTNPPKNKTAKLSDSLDFSHADSADAAVLNVILWKDRKGNVAMPKPKHTVIRNED